MNEGSSNGQWKGDKVSYKGLHQWVRKNKKLADRCEVCGKKGALDAANISQKYLRDTADWEWLCRKCHMTKDGRFKIMDEAREKRKLALAPCPICKRVFKPEKHDRKRRKSTCGKKCAMKLRWQTKWKNRGTSGIKGVSWHKASKKWSASVQENGKTKHLGVFSTKKEASRRIEKYYE